MKNFLSVFANNNSKRKEEARNLLEQEFQRYS